MSPTISPHERRTDNPLRKVQDMTSPTSLTVHPIGAICHVAAQDVSPNTQVVDPSTGQWAHADEAILDPGSPNDHGEPGVILSLVGGVQRNLGFDHPVIVRTFLTPARPA